MMKYQQYLTRCACGGSTSKKYAREHGGLCKTCFTLKSEGEFIGPLLPQLEREERPARGNWRNEHKRLTGRCEDAPCCGCCGPQGDGDYYGYSAMERAMDGDY